MWQQPAATTSVPLHLEAKYQVTKKLPRNQRPSEKSIVKNQDWTRHEIVDPQVLPKSHFCGSSGQ